MLTSFTQVVLPQATCAYWYPSWNCGKSCKWRDVIRYHSKLFRVVEVESSKALFRSFMSTSEEVAVVDGDNVIAPSSWTRVTPLDPPTSAEEEESGCVTSTSASNNNIHDAAAPTTRRRDSNFSRLTDPTTNVSPRRHREHHHHNWQPPQSRPLQAVMSVRVRCYTSYHFVW